MVRSYVGRGADLFRTSMSDIGDMGILTGRTIVSAVRPPYTYGNEFVYQFLFTLRVCWFPMILASVAFSYGPSGVQAAGFLNLFGALDRLGGLFVLAVVREFAPLVCAIVMAGVAGTAITRRPRRAQDPRGARRPAGAGHRPDQEPRRPPLPRPDDGDGAVRHLRGHLRHLRRRARDAHQQGAARPVLRHLLLQRDHHRAVGLAAQDAVLRRDHRDRLLLQGADRQGRLRGRRPCRQPGGGDRLHRHRRVQLRLHPDAAGDPPRAVAVR